MADDNDKQLTRDILSGQLTLPVLWDMTVRYRRFDDLPEHPALRVTLRNFYDTVISENYQDTSVIGRVFAPLQIWWWYHFTLRRLKVLSLSVDETFQTVVNAIREYEEDTKLLNRIVQEQKMFKGISPTLVEMLACPTDNKPLKLITDDNDQQWLINPRNGYCYPIENGIPIMIEEEGREHRNEAYIE